MVGLRSPCGFLLVPLQFLFDCRSVSSWLDYASPMVFIWFPFGWRMIFLWFHSGLLLVVIRVPFGFLVVLPIVSMWLPLGILMETLDFPCDAGHAVLIDSAEHLRNNW